MFKKWKPRADRLKSGLEDLNSVFSEQEEMIAKLQTEKKQLLDEKWRDNELQALKSELEIQKRRAAQNSFVITEAQNQSIENWKTKHLLEVHNYDRECGHGFGGAIGGNFEYHFCPTSIGTVGTCVCSVCFNKAIIEAEGIKDTFYKKMKEFNGEYCFQDLD